MRLLDPEVFGAAAYIVIIVGMARLLTFQSHKAIIQRKNDIKRLMDNAFTAEFFIAFVAFLALFFAAGPLMRRSNEWYFIRELQVAALGVFAGPLMIPKAILEKRLEFAKANFITFTTAVITIIVQISLALLGMSLWALIIGGLTGQTAGCLLAWRLSPYRPHPRWDVHLIRDILKFGSPLALSAGLAYFYWNIDDLMVKWVMGTVALGYYSKAFRLPHFGFSAQASLSTLVFPAFSSITDREQLCRAYGHTIKYSSYLLLLPVVMVVVFGKEIVFILFGEKWLPISVPFKVFTVLVGIRGIFNHWVDLYVSRGRTRLVTVLAVTNSILIVSLGYLGIRMAGLVGMSIAVFFTISLTILFAVIRIHGEFPVAFHRLLGPSLIAAFVTFVTGELMKPLLIYGLLGLSGSLVIMVLVYVLMHLLLDGAAVARLWNAAITGLRRS
jgi:O-antigen/teichoic acid export membrane protein